jgi:hypothetical protein
VVLLELLGFPTGRSTIAADDGQLELEVGRALAEAGAAGADLDAIPAAKLGQRRLDLGLKLLQEEGVEGLDLQ